MVRSGFSEQLVNCTQLCSLLSGCLDASFASFVCTTHVWTISAQSILKTSPNFQICENVCSSGSTDSPASAPLQIQLKRKGIRSLLSAPMDLRILSFLSEWGVWADLYPRKRPRNFIQKALNFPASRNFIQTTSYTKH